MKTVYVAMQNADLTEGRGPMRPKGYFFKKKDAEEFLKALPGIMGSRQGLEVEEINVYERLYEHPSWDDEMIRNRALLKLTPEERKALGV